MPTGFYKLKVDKIKRETKDAVSIRLLVPPPLKANFAYKAGQYLTLHAMINGEDVRRSYSVCSSPYKDAMPTIAVKQVEDGRMSTFLNQVIKEGDLIDAMPPMGKFTVEPTGQSNTHYFLFGGGSGITPMQSIALTVLGEEPNAKVTLVYANRNEESIIFKEDIDGLVEQYGNRFEVIHILENPSESWTGLKGMLNEMKVKQLISQKTSAPNGDTSYFICGPNGLMQLVEGTLQNMGIDADKINLEYFTAVERKKEDEAVIEDDGSSKQVTVDVYGDCQTITVEPGKTILESAQDAGMDPPFSCTVGVCTTCRARVTKGKVRMDEREGLSDAEIEDGYVLTCQAHPITSEVELTYE